MSFGSFLASLDPTSRSSALGGAVRSGVDAVASRYGVPAGTISGALTAAGTRSPTDRSGIAAAPPAPAPSPGVLASAGAAWSRVATSGPMVLVGAVLAVGLVVWLVVRRK